MHVAQLVQACAGVLVLHASTAAGLSAHSPADLYASPRFKIEVDSHDPISTDQLGPLPSFSPASPLHGARQHVMKTSSGQSFLCSVPAPPRNSTHNKAPTMTDIDARNARRANGIRRGVELIEALRGSCLFLRQGWFTYSFCYDSEVRQFHEVPRIGATRPVEDPNSEAYVLGQSPSNEEALLSTNDPASSDLSSSSSSHAHGDMVSRTIEVFLGGGDLLGQGRENGMYLAQRWQGGTLCDKTGAPRSVEIQYHCNTETTDRIALVREVAICQYVMLIHTPRLCAEPLFLEGRSDDQDPSNVITCRPIVDPAPRGDTPVDAIDDVPEQQEETEIAGDSSVLVTDEQVDDQIVMMSEDDIEELQQQPAAEDENRPLGEGEFETELMATIVYDPNTGEIISTDTTATVVNSHNEGEIGTDPTVPGSSAAQDDAANKALEEFVQKMRETIADALRDHQVKGVAAADQPEQQAAQQQQPAAPANDAAAFLQQLVQQQQQQQHAQQPGTLFIPEGGLRPQLRLQAPQQPAPLKRWTGSEDQQRLVDALKRSYDQPTEAEEGDKKRVKHDEL